jgi:hypothetical protein
MNLLWPEAKAHSGCWHAVTQFGFRQQPIVRVKETSIHLGFLARVSSEETPEFFWRMAYAPKAGTFPRCCRGTVVDNEDLAMRVSLSQSALNRFMQKCA